MAEPVTVNIPHDLGQVEAKRRLETGFARIHDQIGGKLLAVDNRWEDNLLHFKAAFFGQTVSGRAEVFDRIVRIELDLPWVLASIANKLKGRIAKEGTILLEKK